MAKNNISWVRETIVALEKQGWRVRWGSKHLFVYPADKTKKSFTVSTTPSDVYGRNNAIKQIRRAGGVLDYHWG